MHKQADKKLITIPRKDRQRITEKIYLLGINPDDKTLDIKKLINKSAYRLRVGDWRIVFERDDHLKIIAIEKIGARGNIYQ